MFAPSGQGELLPTTAACPPFPPGQRGHLGKIPGQFLAASGGATSRVSSQVIRPTENRDAITKRTIGNRCWVDGSAISPGLPPPRVGGGGHSAPDMQGPGKHELCTRRQHFTTDAQ